MSILRVITIALLMLGCAAVVGAGEHPKASASDWAMEATAIEACSCPLFCQCYFNTKPASHDHGGGSESHFCRFNNAYKVTKGNYGATKLDGALFWIAGDLGGDFSQGQMDWAVLTFDKSLTKEQRDGIAAILGSLFPVKWNSFTTGEGSITWAANKDMASATLDGGKSAEVKLKRFQGSTSDPVVINNLRYWGAPRNKGFVLMPNEVQAWKVGQKTYEFKGTNGFMITFDLSSKDAATVTGG